MGATSALNQKNAQSDETFGLIMRKKISTYVLLNHTNVKKTKTELKVPWAQFKHSWTKKK